MSVDLTPVVPSGLSLQEIYTQQAEAARRKASQQSDLRLAQLQARLKQRPDDPQSYVDLTHCLGKMHKYEEALGALKQGPQRCPASAKLHEMRISLLEECNQTSSSLRAWAWIPHGDGT
jgi:cytochrome c-type biogenesis protein CcmH/NrfG